MMYEQPLIEAWLSFYLRRLPGEDVIDAIIRLLWERAVRLDSILHALEPWHRQRGAKGAGVFLPSGTRIRTRCRQCQRVVEAVIVPNGVMVDGRVVASLEAARRVAINILGCHSHLRSRLGVFWGRPVRVFWEIWHRGEWRPIAYFRMPHDDGRHV
jgi:hypothetical protein